MSILYPHSVGKVHKIFPFEAVFHASASDCTKLTLALMKVRINLLEIRNPKVQTFIVLIVSNPS